MLSWELESAPIQATPSHYGPPESASDYLERFEDVSITVNY